MGGFSSSVQQAQPGQPNQTGPSAGSVGKGAIGGPSPTQPTAQPGSIDSLYQNVLGRAPDQGGADYWKQQFGDTVDDNERQIFMNAAQPELQGRAQQPNTQGLIYGQSQDMPPVGGGSSTNGKGGSSVNSYPGPQGMQGASTNSATSGQPRMGAPNQYPNTVGQWDNTQIKPAGQNGKGKGA